MTAGDLVTPGVVPGRAARAEVDCHLALAARAQAVLDRVAALEDAVTGTVTQDREARVRAELACVEVGALAGTTDRPLRLGALAAAGYRTAADLVGVDATTIARVPGVGPGTARAVSAAVLQLADAVRAAMPVRLRLDTDDRPDTEASTRVVTALHALLRWWPQVDPHHDRLAGYVRAVGTHSRAAAPATSRVRYALSLPRVRGRARRAVGALAGWTTSGQATALSSLLDDLAGVHDDAGFDAAWSDVERRPATYTTALHRLVPGALDLAVERGLLAGELADQVVAHPLDTRLLRSTLRGYQEFGARFLLCQGRAVLGDEMGLGKTVQAVAAMAHLAAGGERHLLVVCPASVLVSWAREVTTHSALPVHRVHGDAATAAAARWVADGGVAVTTFGSMHHLPDPQVLPRPGLAMLVVDEAHLVRNPRARRSRSVARWARATPRVALLTGTPLQRHVDDFVALVDLVAPDLVPGLPRHLGLAGADAFRRAVAPVYLRRNQRDVLLELPALEVVDEWEELTASGARAYAAAVAEGHLVRMRRATTVVDGLPSSGKVGRLLEIVDDARENGRRVVVLSYFRGVLDVVTPVLRAHGVAHVGGPLTGDVPPGERQAMVDRLAAADPHDGAVLVAQVEAGGVGLNLQCASVAVLCEPQLSPAVEAQAFARLHRMGQLRAVRAHRLLAEGTVDERLRAVLAERAREVDAYVRDSVLAQSSVRAVDVTDAALAREVVAWEQARLGHGPVWDDLTARPG